MRRAVDATFLASLTRQSVTDRRNGLQPRDHPGYQKRQDPSLLPATAAAMTGPQQPVAPRLARPEALSAHSLAAQATSSRPSVKEMRSTTSQAVSPRAPRNWADDEEQDDPSDLET